MKKILVTGGAGFLGSFLCEKLVNQGHHVVCCDNFYTGTLDNISNLQKKRNFEILNHDIEFPVNLDVDLIYNLACPAAPIHYQKDPVKTIRTCVNGAINMLELAKRCNARILQASTSEIYGDPEIHPQHESYKGAVSISGPRACYDEGKRCAETIFWDYNRQHKVDIRVVRIFNTYGPRMQLNDGRVVSNFIIQALKNKNITVYGSGDQTRSFCYVDDLIDGIERMMKNDDYPGPINLGNPTEISVETLAKEIITMTKSRSKIVYKKLPIDDPKMRCPDISLAKKKLLWSPLIKREIGLKQTINYFNQRLQVEDE
ncbi:MAG: NAD-dependent dehydratase [Rickettsiales bacterium]|nr:NAD-dependent dehydratase [Rickettsiales bacterium]|tara:strand:- start:824 stop:1768 length:945 start_codon:yes stop_codon:yes gene_type:complete